MFKTFASTLTQMPSLLQAPAAARAQQRCGQPLTPIPVDVEAETFEHILNYMRYHRLDNDLTGATLSCVARAARRLHLVELEQEAKYIYPLRQLKRLARFTKDYDRAYFDFFRESWIRGTPPAREELQPKFFKAMGYLRGRRHPLLIDSRSKAHVDSLLSNNSASAYVLDAIDFADFLAHQGYVAEADVQLSLVEPWLLALPEHSDEARAVKVGIELRHGHKTQRPFFALCALAYTHIDSTPHAFDAKNLIISPEDTAVLVLITAIMAHGAAKYSVHATHLAVAANLFERPLPTRHLKTLGEGARQASVGPSNLLYCMLKHEIWTGAPVFDRPLIELLSWSPLQSTEACGSTHELCASFIAMLFLNHGDRARAQRWTRKWHEDMRSTAMAPDGPFLAHCALGLQRLRQQREQNVSVRQFAAEFKEMAVVMPSGWRALRNLFLPNL